MIGSNLRPLSFGEVLDGAFTLYRRNFRLFVGTSFLLVLGLAIAATVLVATGAFTMAIMPGFMAVLVGIIVAVALAGLVSMLWSTLTWQAARSYAGEPVSLPESVAAAVASAMTLVGAGAVILVAFVATGLGVWMVGWAVLFPLAGATQTGWLLVLAGLVFFLGSTAAFVAVAALFFGVLPAVMVEGKGPLEAISRSVGLARGALPRIAGVLFVTCLIVWLPSLAITAISGDFQQILNPTPVQTFNQSEGSILLEQLLAWAVVVLTMPFLPAVLVMLYYDRRVRTEALDVQILTEQLDLAGA